MESLFSCRPFAGFGPSGLPETVVSPLHRIRGRRASRLRARLRQQCPRLPGVYGMLDANGQFIYVGKAKCLRVRLLSYFRPRSRDRKAGRIVRNTAAVVWEVAADELAALLRELELIRRWQPRFNVHGQPRRRRRSYVCLGRRPVPYLYLAPKPPARAVACFGPVPASRQAREAVRWLNDWYRLRDCSSAQAMCFADQQELFPVVRAAGCIRYEIGTCLGPCAAACTQTSYAAQVRAARAFLAGKDAAPLDRLEAEMAAASAALAFERAAALRDKLEALRWLRDRLEHLRLARERHSFVYPVTGHDGRERWYLIHRGRVAQTVAADADEETRLAALDTVYARKAVHGDCVELPEVDGVLLVAAWFRRHAEERARVLLPEAAKAMCAEALHFVPSGGTISLPRAVQ